ncbi:MULTISPECIES: NfeD family protein [unclassified Photobacterium]|uniref:NfeD family protein n=1 Tax=unclassified Photobacterium TaxID=2628852 RepID=UPI001B8CC41D|nr:MULTISPECIES: NfeD family protein [unclassified Photobacterium]MDO6704679.1 NfeD family protein [Photobacterium sp. 1_MG-2023]QUJ68094.1 NfeD family protein [Photobacterium sp. GJ3]
MINDLFGLSPAQFTIVVGLILLAVEVWMLGLSTIVLLALGVSAVLTGTLALVGVVPETLTALASVSGIGAGLLTFLLWKPMKRSQRAQRPTQNTSSDFIGLKFRLDAPLSHEQQGTVKYSGISWTLVLSHDYQGDVVEKGQEVEVVAVDVGRFTVMPRHLD